MDSLSRHEQLLRVFHLVDILFSARHPLTAADLKARLHQRGVIDEMSERNIRRDLAFLENFGYPLTRTRVRTDRGTTCQAFAIAPGKGADELRPPRVTVPELLSLAVAREFLAPLAGTVYWRGIGQVLAKLERVATPQLLAYVAEHRDGLVVHPRPAGTKYRARTLNAVHRAIHRGLELEVRYASLADATPRRMILRPESLVLYEGAVYVAAIRAPGRRGEPRPAAEGGVRFYKLDRIADARVTSRPFPRAAVAVDELLADSITMFRSPHPARRFRIRVDPERARWACEKPFHPRQKVRRQADGGVILEIDRGWEEEIVPQLLALGELVEVLEPADVRERLADAAQRIADRHAGRAPRSALRAGG